MDYTNWSQEYLDEASKVLRNIEVLKGRLKDAGYDEAKTINSQITAYRYIYYELKLTAQHLLGRAKRGAYAHS